jgi:hypothetical protein
MRSGGSGLILESAGREVKQITNIFGENSDKVKTYRGILLRAAPPHARIRPGHEIFAAGKPETCLDLLEARSCVTHGGRGSPRETAVTIIA